MTVRLLQGLIHCTGSPQLPLHISEYDFSQPCFMASFSPLSTANSSHHEATLIFMNYVMQRKEKINK